ncbi:MAG: type IV secretion protein IcmK [Gammaproteobacteria bacterium]|nr:type IV secretion protein IcmK [Gammaproteobacteria bacterium]
MANLLRMATCFGLMMLGVVHSSVAQQSSDLPPASPEPAYAASQISPSPSAGPPPASPPPPNVTATTSSSSTQSIPAPPSNIPAPVSQVENTSRIGGPTPPPASLSPPPITFSPPSAPPTVGDFNAWLQTNNSTPKSMPPTKQPPPPRIVYQGHKPLTYEESQQVMLESAPPSRIPMTPDSAIAFNMMLQQNMPLSPQQIVQLRQQIDMSQRAAAVAPVVPPKPVSSTLMINLAPGTTPPAVRLAQGYVSSLVFVDSTGSPWPIAAFDIGNPKAVTIQWDGKSNILLLQSILPYTDGDIVIRLVGLPTPVTLELVSGQRVVDYRVDVHVPGIGPNTKDLPIGSTLPDSANQLLLGILDGIPPPGSKTMRVIGADAQAFSMGEKMYLRTRLTLLSPGWIGTMVSPDGMHAYELPKTSSILVSKYGEPAELRIEGW